MFFEGDLDIKCQECGYKLQEDLVKKLIKGKETFCEKCGTKIELKQARKEINGGSIIKIKSL